MSSLLVGRQRYTGIRSKNDLRNEAGYKPLCFHLCFTNLVSRETWRCTPHSNASKASKGAETLVGWQLAGAFSADVLSLIAALGWYRRENNPRVYRELECFSRVPAWNTVRARRTADGGTVELVRRLAPFIWLLVALSTNAIACGALKRTRRHLHGCASRSTGDLPDVACAMLKAGTTFNWPRASPGSSNVILTGSRGDEIASRVLRGQQGELGTRATLNAVDTHLKAKSGEGVDRDRNALRSCSTGFLCNVEHYSECVRSPGCFHGEPHDL
jgi:hypothetical protein